MDTWYIHKSNGTRVDLWKFSTAQFSSAQLNCMQERARKPAISNKKNETGIRIFDIETCTRVKILSRSSQPHDFQIKIQIRKRNHFIQLKLFSIESTPHRYVRAVCVDCMIWTFSELQQCELDKIRKFLYTFRWTFCLSKLQESSKGKKPSKQTISSLAKSANLMRQISRERKKCKEASVRLFEWL